jgi:hypothetical protein
MKTRLVAAALLGACASACASSGGYGPPPPPPISQAPATFDPADFAWSQQAGVASIRGGIAYRGPNAPYVCRDAAVALTPDTPYSRERILRLYGSTERAAVPVSIVRSRQAGAPSNAFSKFVRSTRCNIDNQFVFDRLPPGSWFVIVAVKPQSGQGEQVALLRRVQTNRNPQPRQAVMQ